ncbi:DUF6452 family protein [Bacteroides sedimenti]|uniref:Lipoprotein n=1 Tax=Bacteroides sedimenti TaxID=2136147 RepID=A0ABN6Z3L9_9BACE
MKRKLKYLSVVALLCSVIGLALTACDETKCSTSGRPSPQFNFVEKSTLKKIAFDTLTVVALNAIHGDSVILNKATKVSGATLPLSYSSNQTTLVFNYSKSLSDTIWITHTNTEHFLSMDCGIIMYHQIKDVKCTSHVIDSVAIINSEVDINEKENIRLFY